jgi:hypothetical protein
MGLLIRVFRYWGSHILLLGFIIFLAAMTTGFCEAWLWQHYVIEPADFPLLNRYFQASPASISFVVMILKILLGLFCIGTIVYAMHHSHRRSSLVVPSLIAGLVNWPRLLGVVVPVLLLAWTPAFLSPLIAFDIYMPALVWGLLVTLYCFSRYALALPVLIIDDNSITVSMKKAAQLSKGIRLELLIVMLAFVILSEGVCLALGYLLQPLIIEPHGIWQMALLSSAIYFVRWLLYALILIAIYVYYREQYLPNSRFATKTAFVPFR